MKPIQLTNALQRIVATPRFEERISALSGFPLNKTPDGPIVGAAGELLAEVYFSHLLEAQVISSFKYTGDSPGHDFEVVYQGATLRFDVKTKRRSFEPRDYFEMSVPAYLYSSPGYVDPDYFLCVQVNCDPDNHRLLTAGWIVGTISSADFRKYRYLVSKGTPVGGGNGRAGLMPTDVYNVKFDQLDEPIPI